jgi:hypothetical protein
MARHLVSARINMSMVTNSVMSRWVSCTHRSTLALNLATLPWTWYAKSRELTASFRSQGSDWNAVIGNSSSSSALSLSEEEEANRVLKPSKTRDSSNLKGLVQLVMMFINPMADAVETLSCRCWHQLPCSSSTRSTYVLTWFCDIPTSKKSSSGEGLLCLSHILTSLVG